MKPPLFDEFSRLYQEDLARGYRDGRTGRGGETPSGPPSKAYIDALKFIWEPVPFVLQESGLHVSRFIEGGIKTDVSLDEIFEFSSREFHVRDDPFPVHLRVFRGALTDQNGEAVTEFMLSVPHGHGERFWYAAPHIQIARFNEK
ncbi:hypothetical protein HY988_01285 [Candidatus Micrarchaeota archaeon]|nr:hypothetical protein [Candidatus Micrarchaeota archaeon]